MKDDNKATGEMLFLTKKLQTRLRATQWRCERRVCDRIGLQFCTFCGHYFVLDMYSIKLLNIIQLVIVCFYRHEHELMYSVSRV